MARMRVVAALGAGGRTILRRLRGHDTTLVVGLGGAVGSLGRYGLSLAIPHPPSGFPWSTFLTNVTGCFAIGVRLRAVANAVVSVFAGLGAAVVGHSVGAALSTLSG